MSSRSLLECQEDFALEVIETHSVMQTISNLDAFGGSSRSLKSEMLSHAEDVPYVAVNEIKPEVYSMISAWKSSIIERQKALASDSLMVVEPVSSSNSSERFEPHRRCASLEPPKRFYRTFWRSITRRSLQRAKDQIKLDIRESLHIE